jgi:hypothetical protein
MLKGIKSFLIGSMPDPRLLLALCLFALLAWAAVTGAWKR